MARKKKRECSQVINGKQTDKQIFKEIFDEREERKLTDAINEMYRTIKPKR